MVIFGDRLSGFLYDACCAAVQMEILIQMLTQYVCCRIVFVDLPLLFYLRQDSSGAVTVLARTVNRTGQSSIVPRFLTGNLSQPIWDLSLALTQRL